MVASHMDLSCFIPSRPRRAAFGTYPYDSRTGPSSQSPPRTPVPAAEKRHIDSQHIRARRGIESKVCGLMKTCSSPVTVSRNVEKWPAQRMVFEQSLLKRVLGRSPMTPSFATVVLHPARTLKGSILADVNASSDRSCHLILVILLTLIDNSDWMII